MTAKGDLVGGREPTQGEALRGGREGGFRRWCMVVDVVMLIQVHCHEDAHLKSLISLLEELFTTEKYLLTVVFNLSHMLSQGYEKRPKIDRFQDALIGSKNLEG
jgi:hypothetical protein